MRKNNVVVKKLRNVILLAMMLVIVIGVYINIRNSRANDLIKVTAQIVDMDQILDPFEMELVAKTNEDGTYKLEFPENVNSNNVASFYTKEGEEILLDEDGTSNVELVVNEGASEILLQAQYDKKEIVLDEETNETITLYNKTLGYNENIIQVKGYMPLNSVVEVTEADYENEELVEMAKQENVKGSQKIEISVYEEIEKQEENENGETQTIIEKVLYTPSIYEEELKVKIDAENVKIFSKGEESYELVEEVATQNEKIGVIIQEIEVPEEEKIYEMENENEEIEVEIDGHNAVGGDQVDGNVTVESFTPESALTKNNIAIDIDFSINHNGSTVSDITDILIGVKRSGQNAIMSKQMSIGDPITVTYKGEDNGTYEYKATLTLTNNDERTYYVGPYFFVFYQISGDSTTYYEDITIERKPEQEIIATISDHIQ